MNGSGVWEILTDSLQVTRKATDEIWKIWRWFAIGLLGLLAYENSGAIPALIFGVMMSGIGVITLVSWFLEAHIRSLTEKGRKSGKLISLGLLALFLVNSIFVAIWVWAVVSLSAIPVLTQPQ